ncbi:MAG: hypothetical protein HQ513_13305 [Rhodospirillales bacterium]|nr:hypothetical protein [Rhodospirillales bacterium]
MSDQKTKSTPLNPQTDEREVCERVLIDALGGLIERVIACAEATGGSASAEVLRTTGAEYMAGDGDTYRKELRDHIRQSILQHEKELWDQTRKRPFDRMLVKRFSHLFPSEGDLASGNEHLSRRILPGFFAALEMMTGPELFEQCQAACKGLVRERKEELGENFLWRDFYNEDTPNELVNDVFIVIVPHFANFEKRTHWMLDLINSHLASPEDYAFEGPSVKDWHMDDAALKRLLNALFAHFRESFSTPDGREIIVGRYGLKASRALEDVLANLERNN